MIGMARRAALLAIALALPLAAAPSAPPANVGWDPCGGVKDPQHLWACWGGAAGGHDGVLATTCVPKTACPPTDQRGKPVLSCYYQDNFSTGFRCILFCNYGGPFPWGSDGGNNCN